MFKTLTFEEQLSLMKGIRVIDGSMEELPTSEIYAKIIQNLPDDYGVCQNCQTIKYKPHFIYRDGNGFTAKWDEERTLNNLNIKDKGIVQERFARYHTPILSFDKNKTPTDENGDKLTSIKQVESWKKYVILHTYTPYIYFDAKLRDSLGKKINKWLNRICLDCYAPNIKIRKLTNLETGESINTTFNFKRWYSDKPPHLEADAPIRNKMYTRTILFEHFGSNKLNEKVYSSNFGMGGDFRMSDKPNKVIAKGVHRFQQYTQARLRKEHGISDSHKMQTIDRYDVRNDYFNKYEIRRIVEGLMNGNPEKLHLSE